jgi:hypothetical protein
MYKNTEKWISHHAWISSCSVVLLVFLFFNIVSTPLLNSGDDTFMLYTLGGGYGEPPSNLLQYNHIWHPWLGWIVKLLFGQYPGINWYTIVLLLAHAAGAGFLLYCLFKRSRPLQALLFFGVLFFFFEARQILTLTFTGAAFTAATGALFLLLHQLQQKRALSINSFLAVLVLLLAAMLRLQIVWIVIALACSVAIVFLHKKQWLAWGFAGAVVLISVWGLNKVHQQYYIKKIPGWQQQEKFRQALFYSYNRQLVNYVPPDIFKDSTEQALFFSAFLYDTAVFTTQRVLTISKGITRNRSLGNKEDRIGLYWFFIEMEPYLLLFIGVVTSLLLQRKYQPVKKWLFALLAYLVVHSYLFLFLKITTAIHLGLLLFLWIALVIQITGEDQFYIRKRIITFLPVVFLAVSAGWMGVRLIKENNLNKEKYQRFLCAMHELNAKPDKLFVATDDSFPLNYFYVWNTPQQYSASNLLYKDRLITHTYLQTLQRFNSISLEEALVNNSNVLLVGRALPALEKVFQHTKLTDPVPGYSCLEVRQLNKVE